MLSSNIELDIRHAFGDFAQVLTVSYYVGGERHAGLVPIPVLRDRDREATRCVRVGRDRQVQNLRHRLPTGRQNQRGF